MWSIRGQAEGPGTVHIRKKRGRRGPQTSLPTYTCLAPPAQGGGAAGSVSSPQPLGKEHCILSLLPTPISSTWYLSWGGGEEGPPEHRGPGNKVRYWAQLQAGAAFPAALTPWTPEMGLHCPSTPVLFPPDGDKGAGAQSRAPPAAWLWIPWPQSMEDSPCPGLS